jgi:hypothetical protein
MLGLARRALLLAGVTSCALVSGLSGLHVGDGSDAAVDHVDDVTTLPDGGDDAVVDDVGPPSSAGTALQFKAGCGTTSNAVGVLGLSDAPFTIELWIRLDVAVVGQANAMAPVVWNGGRDKTEPGWSVDLSTLDSTQSALVFCASDQNGGACTTSYALAVGHLVHIAVVTAPGQNSSTRLAHVYALDATKGETVHTLVADTTALPNNWPTLVPFGLAGSATATSCASAAPVTIDDVRVSSVVVATSALDANYATTLPCSAPGLVAELTFSEGGGTLTRDCTTNNVTLALTGAYEWVASPFY